MDFVHSGQNLVLQSFVFEVALLNINLLQQFSIGGSCTPRGCKKGLLGVRTFLPNCSLIYVTSDLNADATNLGVFVSLMFYERLTVM